MHPIPQLRAGFLGLGAMGAPMAHHLHGAGFLKGVFNRTWEKAARFGEDHPEIFIAESPASLATAVDVIFLCVSADRDVLAEEEAAERALGLQLDDMGVDRRIGHDDHAGAVEAEAGRPT